MISSRYAKANNLSFPATYDANLPKQDLIYLDANNLYGCAMSQSLPTHRFRFLQQEESSALKLQASLHNQHNDYSLAHW